MSKAHIWNWCGRWVWVGVGALIVATVVFHILILFAVKFLGPYQLGAAAMSEEALRERAYALHGAAGSADAGVTIDLEEEVRFCLMAYGLRKLSD